MQASECPPPPPPSRPPAFHKADVDAARAAFLAAGGVEAVAKLVKLPLRQEGLKKLPSICDAASFGLFLLSDMAGDYDAGGAFKARCVAAGLVPPLLQVRGVERVQYCRLESPGGCRAPFFYALL